MQSQKISQVKRNRLRRQFIDGPLPLREAARILTLSTATVWRYNQEFERIKRNYPERLEDMKFYMPDNRKAHRPTELYAELCVLLPVLLAAETTPEFKPKAVWKEYKKHAINGYNIATFRQECYRWIKENVSPTPNSLINYISAGDNKTLKSWRLGNNHRNWKIAKVLKDAEAGATIMQLMERVESSRKSVNAWITIFLTEGLTGFILPPPKQNIRVTETLQDRKDKLVKLLHESPKLNGINRTSWTIKALTEVYNIKYDTPASYMQLSFCLKQLGYGFKKSRDMLTSQDPKFREKLNHIQQVLQHLQPKEKFFSIDEYGPVGIKLKGGTSLQPLKDAPKAIPATQRNKGVIICTAALELSTNQVTHFYSKKKNTFEMIKLLELLLIQYKGQDCLYISWDAASWHTSNILKYFIEDVNHPDYRSANQTAEIKLVPLPSCTQFLNVIESVFCGLAKAVIHNSDYSSLEEGKAAIDLHFATRNKHFLENPKRAGRKIWGKEQVVPEFKDTNHCRNRSAMKGAC